MKRIFYSRWFRSAILFTAFLTGSSFGLMDVYYRRMERRYNTQKGLGLARAYARDFKKIHGALPSTAELIPFAEERFRADLERMSVEDLDFPSEVYFRWKENKSDSP